jgi:hypothetical protein
MNTSCNDLPDQGLTGLAPVCFQNDPNNTILGTTVPQPKFTQDCTDAVRCSVTAADNCLLGNPAYNPPVAPGDPTLCYCGNQDPNTCASAGPLASSACKTQWEVASACDSITDATLRNQCVAGQIADLSHASGFAYYILGCAATTCASTCN